MQQSSITLGAPGVGKTTHSTAHPGMYLDPEASIGWQSMDAQYSLYPGFRAQRKAHTILEHELDWSAVWAQEVFPRLYLSRILERDTLTGLVTPSVTDAVCRYLEGCQKHATIVLPEHVRHYTQCAADQARPQQWGMGLRTWGHTKSIRALLAGIAHEVSIPIHETFPEPLPKKERARGSAARESVGDTGIHCVESFFGRWFALNEYEEVHAEYRVNSETSDSLTLTCTRTAKSCERGLHSCGTPLTLTKDVHGVPLNDWIAHDRVCETSHTKPNAVLMFVGTCAPLHRGHLETLEAARTHLEAQGWQVRGGYVSTFTTLRPGRVGEFDTTLGRTDVRNAAIQLGLADSSWLMPDFPLSHVLHAEDLQKGLHPTQQVAHRLRSVGAVQKDETITTFWVNGTDAIYRPEFFQEYAAHADRDPHNPLRILVVDNRDTEDLWQRELLGNDVAHIVERCRVRSEMQRSATAIRSALASADRLALRRLLDLPSVEAYLMTLLSASTLK